MNERLKRIQDFEDFKSHAKDFFIELSKSDQSNQRLASLFSLCICPGGRDGGTNEKEIEVFYGNRPIGMRTVLGPNFETKKKMEIAHGATLSYFRTDDGHVICNLYPAKSENQNPIEEIILLDYITSPSKLKKKAKLHWKLFIACMESTCIDGSPSWTQRILFSYIKNFKQSVIGNVLQDKKAIVFGKDLLKYVLTIGLSGFLILVFTTIKERVNSKKNEAITEHIQLLLENINKSTTTIDQSLKENNLLLKKIAKEQESIRNKAMPTNGGSRSAR